MNQIQILTIAVIIASLGIASTISQTTLAVKPATQYCFTANFGGDDQTICFNDKKTCEQQMDANIDNGVIVTHKCFKPVK